jgi:hypothetical protein
LHDASRFEAAGIPTVVVATDPFRPTVEATADVLGFAGARVLYVRHPVSRLDADGFAELARSATPDIEALLTD